MNIANYKFVNSFKIRYSLMIFVRLFIYLPREMRHSRKPKRLISLGGFFAFLAQHIQKSPERSGYHTDQLAQKDFPGWQLADGNYHF